MSGSKQRVRARAVVRATVSITAADTWGGDCPVDQIARQARRCAQDSLERAQSAAARTQSAVQAKLESDVP